MVTEFEKLEKLFIRLSDVIAEKFHDDEYWPRIEFEYDPNDGNYTVQVIRYEKDVDTKTVFAQGRSGCPLESLKLLVSDVLNEIGKSKRTTLDDLKDALY